MILRINTLKRIGRFTELTNPARDEGRFAKFNVLYALKASGKSTLCDVLRSLSTGEVAYINGRKRLDTAEGPEVVITIAGNPDVAVRFQGNTWHAVHKIGELLDESLIAIRMAESADKGIGYKIRQSGQAWDLSKIDFDKLRENFKKAYKNIEIADLRAFLEKKLAEMLSRNRTRRDFAERLQEIIDNHNAGSSSADADFAELLAFAQNLREEEERHLRMGLTENELEIYDLLCKEKMTQTEEKKVRLAAKALLKRLTEESPKVLVQDWYKDSQTRLAVRDEVASVLDKYLPEESHGKDLFIEKRDRIFELTLDLAINHLKWAA
ncbi:MAG: type I restriction enzyme endonuclease domain-containing protein [Oceanipulchritudo sp.]|jgi:type I restriction enzyme R subunit